MAKGLVAMIVRLLKPWKARKVGTVLSDCPDGAANVLIKRGFAELVKPEPKPERKRDRVGR
jgi:hypothetical protein